MAAYRARVRIGFYSTQRQWTTSSGRPLRAPGGAPRAASSRQRWACSTRSFQAGPRSSRRGAALSDHDVLCPGRIAPLRQPWFTRY